MAKIIDLTKEADFDLIDTWQYSAQKWGIAQADRYYQSLTDKIDTLTRTHTLYSFHHDLGQDIQAMPAEQHIVYFRVKGNIISVLRVLGPGQDKYERFGAS